jgi:FdhD protein
MLVPASPRLQLAGYTAVGPGVIWRNRRKHMQWHWFKRPAEHSFDVRTRVGHNAMDKLTGAMLRSGRTSAFGYLVVFSGRLGYELVQKSLAASVQIVCSLERRAAAALELAVGIRHHRLRICEETGFTYIAERSAYSGN